MLASAPHPSAAIAGASALPGPATRAAVVVAEPSQFVLTVAEAAVYVLPAPAKFHGPGPSSPSATLVLANDSRKIVALARHCEPGASGVPVARTAADSKRRPPSQVPQFPGVALLQPSMKYKPVASGGAAAPAAPAAAVTLEPFWVVTSANGATDGVAALPPALDEEVLPRGGQWRQRVGQWQSRRNFCGRCRMRPAPRRALRLPRQLLIEGRSAAVRRSRVRWRRQQRASRRSPSSHGYGRCRVRSAPRRASRFRRSLLTESRSAAERQWSLR